MVTWKGVFPALTTKMTEDGKIDFAATEASIERLINNGVSGVIALPMLGENACFSVEDKFRVIDAAKNAVAGRVPLLTGLAEITTETAKERAAQFQQRGVDGLMLFPSIGYKTDPHETEVWYRAVSQASDLPIMIYNNPLSYGVDVTPEILTKLADCSTIVAVKDEAGDVRRVTDMYVENGDRYRIFCGVDDQIVESMALGSIGWVSGMTNVWPAECVRIFNLVSEGRPKEALELYRILTPAFHLDTEVKLVQNIKLAESLVYGAPEWCIPPRLSLAGVGRDRVVGLVQDAMEKLVKYSADQGA